MEWVKCVGCYPGRVILDVKAIPLCPAKANRRIRRSKVSLVPLGVPHFWVYRSCPIPLFSMSQTDIYDIHHIIIIYSCFYSYENVQ
ncbi:hypothetical protein NPIL_619061 [Nephila pilipes]|uniref:Uncharacterized protein n=1 Tax=Nephila pilipes TaxID=299642 RepID=A0A8X6U2U5_NEPPI|nr:hypothetical protein NPIL_619061 [Nephila pilipes]